MSAFPFSHCAFLSSCVPKEKSLVLLWGFAITPPFLIKVCMEKSIDVIKMVHYVKFE